MTPTPADPRPAPDPGSWAAYWDAPAGLDADGWRRDTEAYARAAADVVALGPDDDVLDWGCGPGFALAALAPRARSVTGADVAPSAVEAARARLAGVPGATLVALDPASPGDVGPLRGARFHVVLVNSVLQYLPDLAAVDAVATGLFGLLAPGGRLLLSDLPTGSGRGADAWGLLRGAARQGRLREAVRRLRALRHSAYADVRARLGLLAIDLPRLAASLEAAGARVERVRAPLTILANRRHLLARRA